MNPHQWFLMGLTGNQANTFIGGIASTINTPALLAGKLAISASDIQNFKVVGSDIQCYIGINYSGAFMGFNGSSSLTYYKDNDGKIINMANRFIRNNANLTAINFPNLTTTGDETFMQCHSLQIINLPNLTGAFGNFGSYRNNNNLKEIILPKVINIVAGTENSFFQNNPVLKIIYIPLATNLGGTQGRESLFNNSNLANLKIYANPVLQTSNGGAEEGDIAYARSQGATIIYVTNFIAPNPVTDLAVAQVWEDAVKLEWTTPSGSTNAIDYYELYQNGIFVKNVMGNEAIAANLQPSTNYTFKLIAVDIFFNKSTDSNVVSQTTNALGSGRLIDPLVPKLISSYRLNSDLVDVVNGYNGTGTNITYAAGKVGNAAVMTDGFINLNRNDIVGGKSEFSISCWYKNNAKQRNIIYGSWIAPLTIIVRWDSGNLQFFTYTSAQVGGTFATIPYDNVWRHIVATYDGTTMKMYVNGVLLGTTFAQTGALNNGGESESWGSDRSFTSNMSLDAGHIFNTALTATEVSNLYAFEDAGGQLI